MSSKEENVERELLARTEKINDLIIEKQYFEELLEIKDNYLQQIIDIGYEFEDNVTFESLNQKLNNILQVAVKGIEEIGDYNLTKADKNFADLRFKKQNKEWGERFYNNAHSVEISFNNDDKEIFIYCEEPKEAVYIDRQLLKAINKKVKELKWYE